MAHHRVPTTVLDQDTEDETERGCALVRAEQTWCIGMAKWIGERRAEAGAEEEAMDLVVDDVEQDGGEEEEPDGTQPEPTRLPRLKKWPQMKLVKLFKGRAPPPCPPFAEIEAQAERDAQNTAADAEEDEISDDGAVEIDSEEHRHPPSTRAAARARGHGSTAPVPRVPCPFRRAFWLTFHGTATARVSAPTARGKTAVTAVTGLIFPLKTASPCLGGHGFMWLITLTAFSVLQTLAKWAFEVSITDTIISLFVTRQILLWEPVYAIHLLKHDLNIVVPVPA
ncbi:hypothetical protein K438DRAFT_1947222 [Mycena galopus ATCC 62051]|nr:hypothetical protein K438DRAFT_1947222 [Mycena galopus ATCC 62051]